MSIDRSPWREQLTEFIKAQARPAYKYGHQPRLYALTQHIAAASPDVAVDDDVLFAAAFLHDLGVFLGHRPEEKVALESWDHVAYSCDRSPALLRTFGFPEQKISAVLSCIREHQPKDEPHSPEAVLLRDADMLEQLGAIAVLRTAAKIGSDTRFSFFSDAKRSLERAVEELPAKLRLPATRTLAEPRIAALQGFLQALDRESGPDLG